MNKIKTQKTLYQPTIISIIINYNLKLTILISYKMKNKNQNKL